MTFEWDDDKAKTNQAKHRVTFQEASTVFGDPLAITFDDPDHSEIEERSLTFGMSVASRLLVIVHTARDESIRIISAREMSKTERNIYEKD
jgi:uncharacterized protein